ncbi:VacJ family lipoprotein [Gammaproteobacteria bacterium]|nr:VacJ family lipoprotein [Gammaproteobacteria bacterium]MDC1112630.1 VacJ family lipoprotein [bacterium]MDC1112649.1 VacJ family lipoprotein [bacterium]MDC3228915.1 VacJ family lipoprotein [Gammaproteobacteria bacterium]
MKLNKFNLTFLFLILSIHSVAADDPFEDYNRKIWAFNEFLDDNFAKPTAEIYTSIAPDFVEVGVSNFFRNLNELDNTANQLLQGRPLFALNDFSRFLINSTLGLGGFIDVGSKFGLERHDEDFGQTLGAWGVSSGPFLMIPIYGPSTPRGLAGRSVSSVLSGTFAIEETDIRLGITALDALETRARYLEVETLIIGDRYSFIRDSYMQYQEFESSNGEDQSDDFVDDMDDFLLD